MDRRATHGTGFFTISPNLRIHLTNEGVVLLDDLGFVRPRFVLSVTGIQSRVRRVKKRVRKTVSIMKMLVS